MVPADRAAGSYVVVWRLRCFGVLERELGGVGACGRISAEEKSVIDHHVFQNATGFGMGVDGDQGRLPAFWWLPKLHRQPYRSRFVANSSSSTAAGLSESLTSSLATIRGRVVECCEEVCGGPLGVFFGRSRVLVGLWVSRSRGVFVRPVCLHVVFLHC